MIRKLSTFSTLLYLVLAAGCTLDEDRTIPFLPLKEDTVTITFQDGVSPDQYYSGTRDAVLKDGPFWEIENGNFGNVGLDTVGTVKPADEYYERRLILRMDLTSITSCGTVLGAQLSLSIETVCTDTLLFEAFEVTVPDILVGSWPEGTGVIGEGVSWHAADGVEPWERKGGDYIETLLDTAVVSQGSAVNLSLPGALVLKWIENPWKNHGIIIKNNDTAREGFHLVHMRESSTAELRPRLRISYLEEKG